MRIPLYRRKGDETPIARWEWLFAPIMLPLFILLLLVGVVIAGVLIPVDFVYRYVYHLRQQRLDKQLRSRLVATGRFLEWSEVEAKLQKGEGTLIVEHCAPKGPIREWWTADDLIAASPVPLPLSLYSQIAAEHWKPLQEYATSCVARYLDGEMGLAYLTEIPVLWDRRLASRRYVAVNIGEHVISVLLVIGRNLAKEYPAAKIVTVITWLDKLLLFASDAEVVFLTNPQTSVTAEHKG
jgi:hypothetical protein